MKAFVAEPDTTGRHPGVVVVMGRTGIDEALQEQVADLAARGFVSIAPDMFHRENPNPPNYGTANMRVLDINNEKDVNVAISYLMATRRTEVKAAAVFYGGNIMKPRGDGPSPFEQTANISCPVIGLFGLEDENPSPVDVQKIDAELTRLGKVHEFHSNPDAGHAFMARADPATECTRPKMHGPRHWIGSRSTWLQL